MSILVPKSDRRARAVEIQRRWRGAGIPPRVEEYKEILAPLTFNDQNHHDSAAHVWSCGLTGLAKLRALGDEDPEVLRQWMPGTPVIDLVNVFLRHRTWITTTDGSVLPRMGDVVIVGTNGGDIHVTNADEDVALDKRGLSFTAGGHQTGPYMNIGAESRWFHMQGGKVWVDGKPLLGFCDLDKLDLPYSIGGDLVAPNGGGESAPSTNVGTNETEGT